MYSQWAHFLSRFWMMVPANSVLSISIWPLQKTFNVVLCFVRSAGRSSHASYYLCCGGSWLVLWCTSRQPASNSHARHYSDQKFKMRESEKIRRQRREKPKMRTVQEKKWRIWCSKNCANMWLVVLVRRLASAVSHTNGNTQNHGSNTTCFTIHTSTPR